MSNKPRSLIAVSVISAVSLVHSALASGGQPNPTPTPAGPVGPSLVAPAAGASLVQPIKLSWNTPASTTGAIGSYTWQVGTTSGFTTIIASGFTNQEADPSIPIQTVDKVSGLPNGTYFWRVKASEASANGGVDTAWSAVRSFTVTGLGPAPAAPAFTTPANNAQFHVTESFKIAWTAVAGAHHYILESDDEPTFSYPLNLMLSRMDFGTKSGGLWGNALTAYYRVRAVSADGVRGLPSAPIAVQITNAAPVPPAVSPVTPADGATVQLPFFLHWSDTPNPQVPGYEVDVNTSATFASTSSVLGFTPTRSDYMITRDLLAPGSYFWRVRALHGDVAGPWSAARAITVTAPVTAPNVNLFAILAEPGSAYGGNSAHARVMLDNPAPAGGAIITLSTDIPQVNLPATTITVPAGKTDATIDNIATGPVPHYGPSVGIIGDLFAGYANGQGQNSFGVLPIYEGLTVSNESVVGGTSITGTITLQSPAPPGGVMVALVSSDTSLVNPPATVLVPAGATGADFSIPTAAVSVPTRITIDSGTAIDGYAASQVWLTLTPAGSATPPPSLSALTLSQPAVASGDTVTGTVTLTSPAPAGGAVVTLQGSMEGQVIVPASVTVPAGSLTASFTTTPAPETPFPQWVFIGGHYGTSGGNQSRILEVDPAAAGGAPTLLAIGPAGQDLIGGNAGRGSVALVIPAPAGGAIVNLTTDNPTVIHVPASVSIGEGNSAASFTINTSPVSALPTGGNVTASVGGVTKSIFVTVHPDPNAPPLLQSLSISPASVTGGTTATGTVFFSAPAPSGGMSVTLSTSNTGVATAPGIVNVPAGQTSASFPLKTFAVTANTSATITASLDSARTATITVTRGTAPTPAPTPVPTATPAPSATPPTALAAPSQLTPAADARFAPGTNITFDWSDVAGAASYTIQVSDQSTFSTTPIVNQNVTGSQFSTSTLPVKTMWSRVRANDASGNAGPWSAARRFEVKS